MSTAAAMSSSSSSASSRVSWQPSQEANLKTAILSLGLLLELIFLQQRPHLVIGKDRSVFANEVRSVLAMAAEADSALHVPFHRKIDIRPGQPLGFQFA